MVKIGWLADQVGIVGGAELSGSELINSKPDWAEIHFCPVNRRPPDDISLFIIQNSVTYGRRWIDVLDGKQLIKHFRDPWHPGDVVFRHWVMDHIDMAIFNSHLAIKSTPWRIRRGTKVGVCPPPVDLDAFRRSALPEDKREGNIFVGRVDLTKGAHLAIHWALDYERPLDLFGSINYNFGELPEYIRFHGPQPYTVMPRIFGKAKRFVFLPVGEESYSRTTVEAWAAQVPELVLNRGKIGALEWIEQQPDALEGNRPVELFWDLVEEVA